MPNLSIAQGAAINRLARLFGGVLTNSVITSAAVQFGLSAEGSNKQARLTDAIAQAVTSFSPTKQESLIASLTMSAHGLHQAGKVQLTGDDVDDIVREMRNLGLRPGELASKAWRAGLPSRRDTTSQAQATGERTTASSPPDQRSIPRRHEKAFARLMELAGQSVDPQGRGRALEELVFEVLKAEGLPVERNIVSSGEQIDLGFVVDGQHYLLECKWEANPIGFPTVEHFMARVARKAEGTFGAILSMSGFVRGINSTASRGQRLNCVGLSYGALVAVIEGRETWASTIREARSAASTRSAFAAEGAAH